MKASRITVAAVTVALGIALTGCSTSSNSSSGSGQSDKGATLTYWATNQAVSVDADKKILQPELDKFKKKTGITVKVQVVPWSTINTKLLAATASGKGPDISNFGNTNAWTYGSSGALLSLDSSAVKAIGGTGRFISSVLAASGPSPITSVPLYSQAYGLFYNKKMFTDAHLTPPTTWEELLADAKKLTDPATGTYGLAFQGASQSETMHFAYIFGAQNGGQPFDKSGSKPQFTTKGVVDGAQQYVDLYTKGLVNPSDAQYATAPQQLGEFSHNKAAMVMAQNGVVATLSSLGTDSDQYGVVPIPSPADGTKLASYVAGTNIGIFKNASNTDAALKFVKFMTSSSEQQILDKKYQLLPVLKDASTDFLSDRTVAKTFLDILQHQAQPLPVKANNTQYQSTVGGALINLVGKAATGSKVSRADIKKALQAAQDQMPPSY